EGEGVFVAVPQLEVAGGRVQVGRPQDRAFVERDARERVAAGVGIVLQAVADRRLHRGTPTVVAGEIPPASARGPGGDARLVRLRGAGLVAVLVDAQVLVVHRLDVQRVGVGAEARLVNGRSPLPADGDAGRVGPEVRRPGHVFDAARQTAGHRQRHAAHEHVAGAPDRRADV